MLKKSYVSINPSSFATLIISLLIIKNAITKEQDYHLDWSEWLKVSIKCVLGQKVYQVKNPNISNSEVVNNTEEFSRPNYSNHANWFKANLNAKDLHMHKQDFLVITGSFGIFCSFSNASIHIAFQAVKYNLFMGTPSTTGQMSWFLYPICLICMVHIISICWTNKYDTRIL